MGQYYQIVNLTKESTICPNGIKLMEHAWLQNDSVSAVVKLLADEWAGDQIIWAGDYGDELLFVEHKEDAHYIDDEGKHAAVNLYRYASERFKQLKDKDLPELSLKEHLQYVILNHDLKEYVSLDDLPESEDDWRVHPLPILCASGNGRGGGDYRPKGYFELHAEFSKIFDEHYEAKKQNQSPQVLEEIEMRLEENQKAAQQLDPNIGRWAGHRLSASTEAPADYRKLKPDFVE